MVRPSIKNRVNCSGEKGLTLIEVLIAMVVFAVGIMGLGMMQVSSIRGNADSMHLTSSCQLATKQMEEFLALDYADARLTDDNGDGAAGLNNIAANADEAHPDNPIDAGGVGGITYNVYMNIADDVPFQNTKTIRVIITWQDEGQSKRAFFDCIKRWGV